MLNETLTKIIIETKRLIKNWEMGIIKEEEFKKHLRSIALKIENEAMDESIEKELAEGKIVMGMKRNFKTGEDEEAK